MDFGFASLGFASLDPLFTEQSNLLRVSQLLRNIQSDNAEQHDQLCKLNNKLYSIVPTDATSRELVDKMKNKHAEYLQVHGKQCPTDSQLYLLLSSSFL